MDDSANGSSDAGAERGASTSLDGALGDAHGIAAYLASEFPDGRVGADLERLGRYSPEVARAYVDMRRAALTTDSDSMPVKVRELVAVGIECAVRKSNPPPIRHARNAIDSGASVADVAAVVSLCIALTGMVSYMESGRFALEAAEQRAHELEAATSQGSNG